MLVCIAFVGGYCYIRANNVIKTRAFIVAAGNDVTAPAHRSTLCFAAHATRPSCLGIVDAIGDVVPPAAIGAWGL